MWYSGFKRIYGAPSSPVSSYAATPQHNYISPIVKEMPRTTPSPLPFYQPTYQAPTVPVPAATPTPASYAATNSYPRYRYFHVVHHNISFEIFLIKIYYVSSNNLINRYLIQAQLLCTCSGGLPTSSVAQCSCPRKRTISCKSSS